MSKGKLIAVVSKREKKIYSDSSKSNNFIGSNIIKIDLELRKGLIILVAWRGRAGKGILKTFDELHKMPYCIICFSILNSNLISYL